MKTFKKLTHSNLVENLFIPFDHHFDQNILRVHIGHLVTSWFYTKNKMLLRISAVKDYYINSLLCCHYTNQEHTHLESSHLYVPG